MFLTKGFPQYDLPRKIDFRRVFEKCIDPRREICYTLGLNNVIPNYSIKDQRKEKWIHSSQEE